MPDNGSGSYTRTDGTYSGANVFQQERDAGVKVISANLDAEAQDMANAITNRIARDGQTPITANIPFSGFKPTNVGAGTTASDLIRLDQVQKGGLVYTGLTGGTGTALTATLTPAITAYTAGLALSVLAHATTTATAVTLNVNGLGAVSIFRADGTALAPGDILINGVYDLIYQGTSFFLKNPTPQWNSWVPVVTAIAPMTITSQTVVFAKYRKLVGGNTYQVKGIINISTGGSASNGVNFTLPVNVVDVGELFSGAYFNGTSTASGVAGTNATTTGGITRYDAAPFVVGAGQQISFSGLYQGVS